MIPTVTQNSLNKPKYDITAFFKSFELNPILDKDCFTNLKDLTNLSPHWFFLLLRYNNLLLLFRLMFEPSLLPIWPDDQLELVYHVIKEADQVVQSFSFQIWIVQAYLLLLLHFTNYKLDELDFIMWLELWGS